MNQIKNDSVFKTICEIARPKFCGESTIILDAPVKIFGINGKDEYLNGVTGIATHPPDWGNTDKGWIGIIVDPQHLKTTLSNIVCVHQDNVTFVLGKYPAMRVNKNVDLGSSFEKLKTALTNTVDIHRPGTTPQRFATDLGRLQSAVKRHLLECTDITGEELQKDIEKNDPDDLRNINI